MKEKEQLKSDAWSDLPLRDGIERLSAAANLLATYPTWVAAQAEEADARHSLASRLDALGHVQEAVQVRVGDTSIMMWLKEWAIERGRKHDVRRTEFGELRHGNRHF